MDFKIFMIRVHLCLTVSPKKKFTIKLETRWAPSRTRVLRKIMMECRLKRIDRIFFGGLDIKNTFETHELEQIFDPILQTADLELSFLPLDLLQT